jgi:hypothetical protein
MMEKSSVAAKNIIFDCMLISLFIQEWPRRALLP